MVRYGMTPMQAIQAATGRASEEMGRSDVGAVAPGRYGDLIAVKADPLTDIRVLERIDHVMKGGTIIR
jgi:imidazolonepropionase-like amidohydrolase